jgi:hypothetical protein
MSTQAPSFAWGNNLSEVCCARQYDHALVVHKNDVLGLCYRVVLLQLVL